MTKEQVIDKIQSPILRVFGWIHVIGLLMLSSSPFLVIWNTWALGGKVAGSGVLVILITKFFLGVVKQATKEAVEDIIVKEEAKKRKSFQEALREKMSA